MSCPGTLAAILAATPCRAVSCGIAAAANGSGDCSARFASVAEAAAALFERQPRTGRRLQSACRSVATPTTLREEMPRDDDHEPPLADHTRTRTAGDQFGADGLSRRTRRCVCARSRSSHPVDAVARLSADDAGGLVSDRPARRECGAKTTVAGAANWSGADIVLPLAALVQCPSHSTADDVSLRDAEFAGHHHLRFGAAHADVTRGRQRVRVSRIPTRTR